jgi:hypothetical protein
VAVIWWRPIQYSTSNALFLTHDAVIEEPETLTDGVLRAQFPESLRELGEPEGDGLRFVKSELRYMTSAVPWLVPEVVTQTQPSIRATDRAASSTNCPTTCAVA